MARLSDHKTAQLVATVTGEGQIRPRSAAYVMYRLTIVWALGAFLGMFVPWGIYENENLGTNVAANATTAFSSPVRILTVLAAGILVMVSGNRRAYVVRRGRFPTVSLALFGLLALVTLWYLIDPGSLPRESVIGSVTDVSPLERGPGLWIVFACAVAGILLSLASFLLDRRAMAVNS